MFQEIQGHHCYVVDIPVFPPPLPFHDGGRPELKLYAEAANAAIEAEQITGPGKYGIEIYYKTIDLRNVLAYNVYLVTE